LHKIEEELVRIQKTEKIFNLDKEILVNIEQYANFKGRLYEAQIELNIITEQYNNLMQDLATRKIEIKMYLPEMTNNVIQNIEEKMSKLVTELIILESKGYDKKHPKINDGNKELEHLRNSIQKEIDKVITEESVYSDLAFYQKDLKKLLNIKLEKKLKEAKVGSYKKILVNYQDFFDKVPKGSLNIARITRQKKVNEKIYLLLKNRFEEVKIEKSGILTDVYVIEEPVKPMGPVSPNRRMIVILGSFSGFVVAIVVVFIIVSIDTRIFEEDQIKLFNLFLLANIPGVKTKSQKRAFDFSMEELAVNIRILLNEKKEKVFFLTSSKPQEGKTFLSLKLAQKLNMFDQKVCLIDLDFEKADLTKQLNAGKKNGIKELMYEKSKIDEIIYTTDENLNFIPIGKTSSDIFKTFSTERLVQTFKVLENKFDVIIVDTVPFEIVGNLKLLFKQVGSLIFVIYKGITRKEDINSIINEATKFGIKINYSILNGVKPAKKYYYYHKK
jgi:Mrp family chromosome partitioning ATPase